MKTEIYPSDYSEFIVIGFYYNSNKKFKSVYSPENAQAAFNINLWRGNVYGVRKDSGKREKLKSVYN